jgi:hypothetical protein
MNRRTAAIATIGAIAAIFLLGPTLFAASANAFKSQKADQVDIMTSLQQQKLELEVKELQAKGKGLGELLENLPLLTALLAITGLLVTMYQNRASKNRDLVVRDEDHIRSDVDQVLTIRPDISASVGEVAFLLDDLNQLTKRRMDRRDSISSAIIRFIVEDCDFANLRHVYVDITAMQCWKEYNEFFTKKPGERDSVMHKYVQSLRQVHNEDPGFCEAIRYNSGGFHREVEGSEIRYRHFVALVNGLSAHLSQLNNIERRALIVQQFKDATKNPTLTDQLFQVGLP